jgi:hypothetical protein
MVSACYGQIALIEATAGFFVYMVAFSECGFWPSRLAGKQDFNALMNRQKRRLPHKHTNLAPRNFVNNNYFLTIIFLYTLIAECFVYFYNFFNITKGLWPSGSLQNPSFLEKDRS